MCRCLMLSPLLLLLGCGSQTTTPVVKNEVSSNLHETEEAAHGAPIATSTQTETGHSPGISLGAKAPSFELSDQEGNIRSLSGLLANGRVALVFYRSADW